MPIKVMILGSSGMAGHVLTLMLREDPSAYEVIDVSRSASAIMPAYILDVTDFSRLNSLIETMRPDVIVNCIGVLNKFAEDHPDQAILINSYLPHFLESKAKESSTKIIHISTDCVFNGKRGNYTEMDFKDGIGLYAQSKALGEIINRKDLTIRTSIIGPELKNGIGLFHWFSQQDGKIKGYTQAFWTGVTTIELAKAIKAAIRENIAGLYQLVYHEKIAKYDLLCLLARKFNHGVQIDVEESYMVDKSLMNTRDDFSYQVPSYDQMIEEMRKWIIQHQEIYPSYRNLLA